MRYLSLFSGIGGFELGIEQAYGVGIKSTNKESKQAEPDIQQRGERSSVEMGQGILSGGKRPRPVCIGFSEIDKYATQIYQKHFPNHKNYGDITKIDEKALPEFDLLVGGFPCQAFSIAGKRRGFDDTRGTMFFEIARIVREKQPRLLLLENVKGLLSHDKGNTFTTIISTLDELGYDCQWQVLNSKNHGVPQNRERVFIIGHLRGTSRPEVFPLGQDDSGVNERESVISGEVQANTEGGGESDTNEPILQDGEDRPLRIRRLTPTECERLQGFPDGWTEGVSDTQRYKTLGNAVTVNVIRDIMQEIWRE